MKLMVAYDGHTFLLYTSMGILATTIFWGFELAFENLFGSRNLRYLSAALVLAIGYAAKYWLDKRYVFAPS